LPEPPKSKLGTCGYYQGHEKGRRTTVYRCKLCGGYFCEEHRNPKVPQTPAPFEGTRSEMEEWRKLGHPCSPYVEYLKTKKMEDLERRKKALDQMTRRGKIREVKPIEYPPVSVEYPPMINPPREREVTIESLYPSSPPPPTKKKYTLASVALAIIAFMIFLVIVILVFF